MTRKQTSGSVVFRPRARIMKLIGAELISDDVVAVTELVKNAHDADASSVSIGFQDVLYEDGTIVLQDDGHGMDLDDLLSKWMEPASAWKRSKAQRRTKNGRRMLGEKGVGRFATDKLGSQLQLISRKRGSSKEVVAHFDWDQYEADDQMLSDVENRWELRKAKQIKDHGTILIISGLRNPWTERMFRRLSTKLSRLTSPFERDGGFQVILASREFPEYSDLLRVDYLDRAPYRAKARLIDELTIEIQIGDEAPVQHMWNGEGELICGPVTAHLHAFDLETEALARIGPRLEVRNWLKQWSGVSVYRDGFRVWPYGEPDDDWLRLDQRRVNNPVVRLSNNQIVGFIEISSDLNPELKDKTNREGLVHNAALDDLRKFTYFAMQALEAERQRIRRPAIRRPAHSARPRPNDPIHGELERIARKAPEDLRERLLALGKRIREREADEETRQQKLVHGFSELASLGQLALGVHEEVERSAASLLSSCDSLDKQLNGSVPRSTARAIKQIRSGLESMQEQLQLFASLGTRDLAKGRRKITVRRELDHFLESVEGQLERLGVSMSVEVPVEGLLRANMQPQSVHRVLHILLQNSLDWRPKDHPQIRIRASRTDSACELLFSDNGPGIPAELADRVLDPFFSGRQGGQGMGLAIARNILTAHGGSIEVVVDGRRNGANIRVTLPISSRRS